MKKYCGPLELIQELPATNDEIFQLKKAERKLGQHMILLGSLFLLSLIAVPVFFELESKHISYYFMSPISWIAGFVLVSTPKRIFVGVKKFHLVRKSLQHAQVEEYQGDLQPNLYWGSLEQFRNKILKTAGPTSTIKIIGSTGLLLKINGEFRLSDPQTLSTQSLAKVETRPFSINLDPREWLVAPTAEGKIERRHLSEEEKLELESKISEITWHCVRPILMPVIVGAFFLFRGYYAFVAPFVLLFGVLFWRRTLPDLKFAKKLRQDLSNGAAIFVAKDSIEGGNPEIEFLSFSGTLWTSSGQPVGIRLVQNK